MHYVNLEVWQCSVDLAIDVYEATSAFPREEVFGLRMQMRRAAVSIASNVAEGEGRRSRRDHARFVLQARGSLYELQTQMMICKRLGYLDSGTAAKLQSASDSVGRLISGTLRFLDTA